MFQYEFPMAALTATIVVAIKTNNGPDILTIRRKEDPFKGFMAFPGGFVNADREFIYTGALRELKEEVGFDVLSEIEKGRYIVTEFLCVHDDPNRDSRGRIVDFGYLVIVEEQDRHKFIAGDDAESISWQHSVDLLNEFTGPLAFDHKDLLTKAVKYL